jgi:hypothetical protein
VTTQTSQKIIGARDAAANDNVVGGGKGGEQTDVGRIELTVAVGEENEGQSGGADTGNHSRAVAPIYAMMDDFHVGIRCGETIGNFAGRIAAAVVNNDYFPVAGKTRELVPESADNTLDVESFVVRREKYAKAGQFVIRGQALIESHDHSCSMP